MKSTAVERSTRLGRVRGFERLGAETYLGLRYAQPARRFESSVLTEETWTGAYDGTTYRAMAPQPAVLDAIYGPTPDAPFSEDCLFLNIYVPKAPATTARPVIVFIHGGSFAFGGANFYDGTALANGADAVVVCINYRLGVFAAFDLAWLATERDGGGQLWLGDQITALKWVRENIADFGGDPNLVTIIGESAGAVSVAALCAAPTAETLVHRAVACSTAYLITEPSNDVVGAIAKTRRCSRPQAIEYLKSATSDELMGLQRRGKPLSPSPVANTPLLPGRMEELLGARGNRAVPMIAGYATHEGRSLDLIIKLATRLPPPLINIVCHLGAKGIAKHGAKGQANVAGYLQRLKKATGSFGFGSKFNDLVWTDGFRRAATEYVDAISRAGSNGYLYVMDIPMLFGGKRIQSSHGIDLSLTFNVPADPEHSVPAFADHANAPLLADKWVKMLGHFARFGDPGDVLGQWPPYQPTGRSSLRVTGEGFSTEQDVDALFRQNVWT
jgi:para-nitrobenzyl esterase